MTSRQLAEDHWDYVKSIIQHENIDVPVLAFTMDEYLQIIGHHFVTAFLHGFKHGKDSVNERTS